jgi:hypothetical protein
MGIGDMECPVFRPTLEDIYGPFERYIEKIEKKMAKTGICKIVPPESWTPRRGGYPDNLDLTIERPIRQHATGSRGLYRALYIEQKPLNLASEFRPQALEKDNMPSTSDAVELERKYWKNITLRPPLYGADVAGSLFDEKAKVGMHAEGAGSCHCKAATRKCLAFNAYDVVNLAKASRMYRNGGTWPEVHAIGRSASPHRPPVGSCVCGSTSHAAPISHVLRAAGCIASTDYRLVPGIHTHGIGICRSMDTTDNHTH